MVLLFLVLEGFAYIHVINQPHLFFATALLRVVREKIPQDDGTFQIVTVQIADRVNQTLSSMATQPSTFDVVRNETGINLSDEAFRSKVTVRPLRGTDFIEISVTDQNPDRVYIIANAFASALQQRHQTLEIDAPTGTVIQVIEKAREPSLASSFPKRSRFFGLSIAAALASILFGYILAKLNKKIETPEDISTELDLPCIGSINTYKKGPLLTALTQDAYQNIASMIKRRYSENIERILSVTGTRPGEGKSFTISNIAIALGEIGDRVVIVDLDIRNPSLHHLFEVGDPNIGIGPAILNNRDFPKPQKTNYPNVYLIPAGTVDSSLVSRIYESPRLKKLFNHITSTQDNTWLLVDLPPILAVPATIGAAVTFQNTLFVMRSGVTHVREAKHSISTLLESGVRIVGGVLTGTKAYHHGYTPYYPKTKIELNKTTLSKKPPR